MIVLSIVVVFLTSSGGSINAVEPGKKSVPICSNSARLYPDPSSCQKFFRCVNGKHVSLSCPPKTVFDPDTQVCAWRDELSGCVEGIHETTTGQRNLRSETNKKLTLNIGTTQKAHSSAIYVNATLKPSADFVTAASAQHKTWKVRLEIPHDKSEKTVKQNHITGHEIIFTRPSNHTSSKSSFDTANLKGMEKLQSSLLTAKPIVMPTTVSNDRPKPVASGGKWYHTMNKVTTTIGDVIQSSNNALHSSATNSLEHQSKLNNHVIKGHTEDNNSSERDNTTRDLLDSSDVDNKPLTVSSGFTSGENTQSEITKSASVERTEYISAGSTKHVNFGSTKDVSVGNIKYVSVGSTKDVSVGNIKDVSVGSTKDTTVVSSKNVIVGSTEDVNMGSTKDVSVGSTKGAIVGGTKDVSVESTKDVIVGNTKEVSVGSTKDANVRSTQSATQEGTEESAEGFESLNIDEVQNSTTESNKREVFEDMDSNTENQNLVTAWVDNVVSTHIIDGDKSVHDSELLSLSSDIYVNAQTSRSLKNISTMPDGNILTEDLSGNASGVISKNSQRSLPSYHTDEELKPPIMHTSQNMPNTENSNEENAHFKEIGKLIEPFRARVDLKSYKRNSDKSKNSVPIRLSQFKDDIFSKQQTWASRNTQNLPRMIEHLTGKIVNRDLLIQTKKEKARPRWYDQEINSETYISSTSPTKVIEAKTSPSDILKADPILENRDKNGKSEQIKKINKETVLTSHHQVKAISSEADNVRSPMSRERHGMRFKHYNAKTLSTKPSSADLMESDVEETAIRGYRLDVPPAMLEHVTNDDVNVNFMSAPYLVKGLTRPFRCPELDGHFPDPKNCAVFYHCSKGQAYRRDCEPGQVFHSGVQSCVSANLAPPCPNTLMDNLLQEDTFAKSVCKDPNGLYKDAFSCAHYFECTNGWPIRRKCMMGTLYDDIMKKCSWSKIVPGCEQETTPEIEHGIMVVEQFQCPRDGYFRDVESCDIYYLCAGGHAVRMTCDHGTGFDMTLNMCVWNNLLDACKNKDGLVSDEGLEDNSIALKDQKDFTKTDVLRQSSNLHKKEYHCPEKNGAFPDTQDCSIYYTCTDDVAKRLSCPDGRGYDVMTGLCIERTQLPQCLRDNIYNHKMYSSAPGQNTAPFSCPEAHGLYSDPYNCSFFIHCFKKVAYRHQCQPGTVFNTATAACTWRELVPECQNTGEVQSKEQRELGTNSISHSKKEGRAITLQPYKQSLSVVEIAPYKVQQVGLQQFTCPDIVDGFYRDSLFCDVFHRCVLGTKFTFTCPTGTFFRLEENLCDFMETVHECTKDGIRLNTIGSLPEVVPLSQSLSVLQTVTPEEFDVSVVGIDADPTPCPAASGLYPHPRNCHQFLFCSHFVPLVLTCPGSLLYNSQTLTCDFAKDVQCFKYDDYRKK